MVVFGCDEARRRRQRIFQPALSGVDVRATTIHPSLSPSRGNHRCHKTISTTLPTGLAMGWQECSTRRRNIGGRSESSIIKSRATAVHPRMEGRAAAPSPVGTRKRERRKETSKSYLRRRYWGGRRPRGRAGKHETRTAESFSRRNSPSSAGCCALLCCFVCRGSSDYSSGEGNKEIGESND